MVVVWYVFETWLVMGALPGPSSHGQHFAKSSRYKPFSLCPVPAA